MSREMDEWRAAYDVTLDPTETRRILAGDPSLSGLGLSAEEAEIAGEVVQSKRRELQAMTLEQLVDFVRLESF